MLLPDSCQYLRHRGLRQDAFQERDRVAGLDRLDLLAIAEHPDGHAGPGLELEERQHRARTDLADLVDDEHGLLVCLEFSGVDRIEEGLQGPGLVDAGLLEGVRLPPGGRHADHGAAVLMPGLDQGPEERRLAGSGDAGEQRQLSAAAERMDGGELLFREANAGVLGFDPPDRRADHGVGEVGRAVAGGRARHVGDGLFDAELLGVADPLPAFMQAEDQRDGLAVMDEAASLDESHDRVDVAPSASGAGFNEAPRGMDAQAFGVEDGVQLEFRREGCGGARVGRLEPLRVRPPGGLRGAEDGSRRPADGRRLVSPDRVRFLLGLAEAPGGARFMQDLLLALERELVPVHRVFAGVPLRVADHLSVAFRESGDRALGDVEDDGRFAAGVEADSEAKRAQTVGEAGLKERSVFRHLVGGQGLGVDRADPAVIGDDEVRYEIVQMVVGVAGDWRVEEIGRPVRPVLDRDRGSGRVMGEGDPADLARLRPLLPRVPLAGEAQVVSGVAKRIVACGMDRVADHLPLGFGRGELGGERHGLVRGEHEVEAGVLADVLAPVRAGVGASGLEEGVEIAVAGVRAGASDPERRCDARVHVGPPVRPLAPAGVVGRQALSGFELAAVESDAADCESLGLRLVLGHVGADHGAVACSGDFAEVEHRRRQA